MRRKDMSNPIDHAREKLMSCGKKRLIQNKGKCGAFNLREITAESGIALGTFYNYFDSKDDFILQIMDADWEEILKTVGELASFDLSLYEKVKRIYFKISLFEQTYRYTAMSQLKPEEKNLAHIKRKEQEANILLKAFLQEEIDKGELGLEAKIDSAAYFLIQLLFAAGRNPEVDFDELWKCMNFRDTSVKQKGE